MRRPSCDASVALALRSSCTASDSLILLTRHGQGVAGLADRAIVLGFTSVLAASLCARLFVSQPCHLLSQHHNVPTRTPLSCVHDWSRYFALTHETDGAPMLVERKALAQVRAKCSRPDAPCTLVNGSVPADHIRRVNPPPNVAAAQVLAQLEEARAAIARGHTFIWNLDHYFYYWRDAVKAKTHLAYPNHMHFDYESSGLHPDKRGNASDYTDERERLGERKGQFSAYGAPCALPPRVEYTSAPEVLRMVRRFEHAIGKPLSRVFGLHIRAEVIKQEQCDWSPSGVARWLACGEAIVPRAPAHEPQARQRILRRGFPRGAHFVIFTNEDSAYAEATATELRRLAGPSGSAHTGDAIIRDLLAPDFNRTGNDNFILMQVIHAVVAELSASVRIGYGGTCLKHAPRDSTRPADLNCDQPMVLRDLGAGSAR